jgi:predicted nucleotidyltransferase
MLKNIEATIPADIIETFNESKHTFYLTGSRYWGNAHKNSDWDFFVEMDEEVKSMLKSIGFERLSNHIAYVDDIQCTDVYEKYVSSKNGGDVLIQVQMVASAEIKNLIQEKLYQMYPGGLGNKSEAKIIWKNAFEFFHLGRKASKS